jgi:hypothetical protein
VGDTGKVVNIKDCYADFTDERPTWQGHEFDTVRAVPGRLSAINF